MLMSKKILLLGLTALLAVTVIMAVRVLAQETMAESEDVTLDENVTATDLGVSEPTDGLFGFLKNIAGNVRYALTFDLVKKTELKLEHANTALLKAEQALAENPQSLKAQEKYKKYLQKYEERMNQLQAKIENIQEKAADNPRVERLLNRLTDNALKQQRLMDKVGGYLTDDQKTALQEKRETALTTVGEALKKLDEADRLPARLENIMENQQGSSLIHLKSLEVINKLKNRLPAEAAQGLENAAANILKKINQTATAMDPAERQERFKAYFENSNSDLLSQVEILQQLEGAPADLASLRQLKSKMQEIKNDEVEKMDRIIESAESVEARIKNLERIRNVADPKTKILLKQIEQKFVSPEAADNTPLKSEDLKEAYREKPDGDAKEMRSDNNENSQVRINRTDETDGDLKPETSAETRAMEVRNPKIIDDEKMPKAKKLPRVKIDDILDNNRPAPDLPEKPMAN